jgi:hypothetical protein
VNRKIKHILSERKSSILYQVCLKVIPAGGGTSGSGEDVGKGDKGVNMVEILCTHV